MLAAREEFRFLLIVQVLAGHGIYSIHRIKVVGSSGVGLVCACSSIGFLPLYYEMSDTRPSTIVRRLRARKGIHLDIFAVRNGFAVSSGQTRYVFVQHRRCCYFLDPTFCFLLTKSTTPLPFIKLYSEGGSASERRSLYERTSCCYLLR